MSQQLLIIEDESDLRNMLQFALEEEGYSIATVANGSAAWRSLTQSPPDLILLDWMLPDISGVDLLRRIRGHEILGDKPVIMLTARAEEQDKVRGLDAGADDYIVKPFSVKELKARIRTRLRPTQGQIGKQLSVSGLLLDEAAHRLQADGQAVHLGPTEMRLLSHFMRHTDRVYSRDQLLDSVWGSQAVLDERTVDVHIRRLRKALAPFGKDALVQTVHGVGYRFSEN